MVEEDNTERSTDPRRQAELELLVERILVRDGIGELSIDRLAQEAGYSRPTVYRHFRSKEDAVKAVIIKTIESGEELYGRLAEPLVGNRREQAMAIFVALEQVARFHPDTFQLAEMLAFKWMRRSVPEDTQWQWVAVITSYFRRLEGYLVDSAERGELTYRHGMDGAEVAFHSINMAFGMYTSILTKRVNYHLASLDDDWKSVRTAIHTYWDGLGWQPLSTAFDYEATHERILKDVFPEYWLRVKTELLEEEVKPQERPPSQSTGEPA